MNCSLYLNAIEVAETSSNKIPNLKYVLRRMTHTLMTKDNEACYGMINTDAKGNLIMEEGSESIKDACWAQIKNIIERNQNNTELAEVVGNTILSCNPMHKVPLFITEFFDIMDLAHLYLSYGRVEDAAFVLLNALDKKQFIDPVVYAKVCEGLKDNEEYKGIFARLNNH